MQVNPHGKFFLSKKEAFAKLISLSHVKGGLAVPLRMYQIALLHAALCLGWARAHLKVLMD